MATVQKSASLPQIRRGGDACLGRAAKPPPGAGASLPRLKPASSQGSLAGSSRSSPAGRKVGTALDGDSASERAGGNGASQRATAVPEGAAPVSNTGSGGPSSPSGPAFAEIRRKQAEVRRKHVEAVQTGRADAREGVAACLQKLAAFRKAASEAISNGLEDPEAEKLKRAGVKDAAPLVAQLHARLEDFKTAVHDVTSSPGLLAEMERELREAKAAGKAPASPSAPPKGLQTPSEEPEEEEKDEDKEPAPEAQAEPFDPAEHAAHMARVRGHLENFQLAHSEAKDAEEFRVKVAAMRAGSQEAAPHVESIRSKLEAFRNLAADPDAVEAAVAAMPAQEKAGKRKSIGTQRMQATAPRGGDAAGAGSRTTLKKSASMTKKK